MGILDSFRRSKEEKKEKTTPPPQGHTLAEVLQDKNKLYLFGELLKESRDQDLADRFAKGNLDAGDIAALEEKRKIFSEKITGAEKVEKLITKENIIDIARNHPDFETILNLVGPEKAVKVIQSRLKEIAITDESTFNVIASAMEAQESYKNGEYKKVNDNVEALLKVYNVSPKQYLDILAIEDPVKKEEALRKLITDDYGTFEKTVNFFSRGKLLNKELKDWQSHEASLEDAVKELDKYQGEIGNVLFASINGNEDMRNSFFAELRGEKAPEEPKFSFKEVKNGTLDETKWDEDWEERKESTRFSTETPRVQELIRNNFRKDQKKAHREKNKGSGFWHDIVIAITEALMKKKELK